MIFTYYIKLTQLVHIISFLIAY